MIKIPSLTYSHYLCGESIPVLGNVVQKTIKTCLILVCVYWERGQKTRTETDYYINYLKSRIFSFKEMNTCLRQDTREKSGMFCRGSPRFLLYFRISIPDFYNLAPMTALSRWAICSSAMESSPKASLAHDFASSMRTWKPTLGFWKKQNSGYNLQLPTCQRNLAQAGDMLGT